jgi:hypothetical protein
MIFRSIHDAAMAENGGLYANRADFPCFRYTNDDLTNVDLTEFSRA